MSAPEKIWANPYYGTKPHQTAGIWKLENVNGRGTEYRRADLTPPAADYVAGLEAAAAQAENERKARDKGYDTTDYAGIKLAVVIRDRILALAVAARHASPDTRVVTVTQLEEIFATLKYADDFMRAEMGGLHNPTRTKRLSEIRAIIGGQDRG